MRCVCVRVRVVCVYVCVRGRCAIIFAVSCGLAPHSLCVSVPIVCVCAPCVCVCAETPAEPDAGREGCLFS